MFENNMAKVLEFFKKIYKKGGIKLKLIGFTITVIVATVSILNLIIINLMTDSIEKKSFEAVTGSIKHIGYFSRHALLERSYENKLNLNEIIKKIEQLNIDGILDISIYERIKENNSDKYIYLGGFKEYSETKYLNDDPLINKLKDIKSEEIIKEERVISSQQGEMEIFRFIMPITYAFENQTITLGVIILNYDKEAIYGVINQIIDISILITVGIVFITTLIVYYAGLLFTRPILSITDAAVEVANGNLNIADLDIKSNDEIGILTERFNSMISGLRDRKQTKDSINYASLIQHSLIPEDKLFRDIFSDHFAIWQPRDIVGGDIYSFDNLRNENECFIMIIDCTGHGVPGAFVTMLVKAIERQIISEINNNKDLVFSPSDVLSYFNRSIKHLLKQESIDSISNVGFDGGILYFNKSDNILKFAGAETTLFYIDENKEFKTVRGDRHSIGYKKSDANYKFTDHTIKLEKGMQFYITTDGFIDQKGGDKGFSFGKKKFKELIEKYQNETLSKQKEILLDAMQKHQKDRKRTDDVTVLGIKI